MRDTNNNYLDAKAVIPIRGKILNEARDATCSDRNRTYGEPKNNLECLAAFKEVYCRFTKRDKYCSAHDEAIGHVLGKLARIACGAPLHRDNYIDGAAYLAIAGEAQEIFKDEEKMNATSDGASNPNYQASDPQEAFTKHIAEAQKVLRPTIIVPEGFKFRRVSAVYEPGEMVLLYTGTIARLGCGPVLNDHYVGYRLDKQPGGYGCRSVPIKFQHSEIYCALESSNAFD